MAKLDKNIITYYKEIIDHAHKEIEWVRKAYIWIASIIGLIIIVGGFFTYSNFNDLKSDIKEFKDKTEKDIEQFKDNRLKQLDLMFEEIKLSSNIEATKIQTEIKNKIETEFDDKNIKSLVEQVAKNRIKNIADELINENIEDRINPQLITIQNKLSLLDEKLTESSKKSIELNELTDFSIILLSAQNDDREAFDKLLYYMEFDNPKFNQIAMNAILSIRMHYGGVLVPGYLNINWIEYDNPTKLNINEFIKIYNTLPPIFHADIVNNIWSNQIISKEAKIKFLIDILKNDRSLTAVFYAGKFLSDESKLKWQPFDIKPFIEWYEDKR
ncbi:hypothetical protein JXQ31_03670 [candidate division KSB1 bacterium]|nr:hypothetical protein [candidate division KSB1 bacterium]